MTGIYLTQEGKQEIEAKIAELEKLENDEFFDEHLINDYLSQIRTYKEILYSATILPVEESWKLSVVSITPYKQGLLKSLYKNGVIIQPKQ
jgi:hypothetical protein